MELNYRKAVQDDAELLIEMYNAAFHADYIRYGECPAYGKTKEAMELINYDERSKIILRCQQLLFRAE